MTRADGAATPPGYSLAEGDFDGFFEVPFATSPGGHHASPMKGDLRRMLDASLNPLFRDGHASRAFYVVRLQGQPIGRLVAHVHHAANRLRGESCASFGFFDCADDLTAARMLFEAAERWGRAAGCTTIAGNFNLTPAQEMGVVTGGFEHPPFFDMAYNPPHVPRLLEACGYEAFFPMTTFVLDVAGGSASPGATIGPKQRALLEAPELKWRLLRRRGFGRYMADTRLLLNDSFASNPYFVPVSEAEFLFQAGAMMWIVDERLSPIVYGPDGPVGVVVCVPDLNPFLRAVRSRMGWRVPLEFLRQRSRRRRATIVFGAVRPDWRNRGLVGAMLARVVSALAGAGYTEAGITWVSDSNGASLRAVERLGGRPLHRLHLFRKRLS